MSGSIVYVSTYLPRKCGIATFTQDLKNAVDKVSPSFNSKIIALNDNGNNYDYPEEVLFQIRDKDVESYRKAARKINLNDEIKLVSIQHEFKIFGCEHGENLLTFLKLVEKPVITTFHTVLPAPSLHRKKIVQEIAEYSEYIVVMSPSAVKILTEDYSLADNIVIIPHGIHDLPYASSKVSKEKLGYQNKLVLSSFGLLRPGDTRNSSGKGYEFVLEALPEVVEKFPNLLYLIIGTTHPKTLKVEGERYRDYLKEKVKKLGLEKNVQFIDKFVSLSELFAYLQASDLYICSPLNKNQVCSGTLVYAMGCGRAVVSTPFLHAQDLVSAKIGILTKFRNSSSFTNAITELLSNPKLREELAKNAYADTRKMIWKKVALLYSNLFNHCLPSEVSVAGMINSEIRVPVRVYKVLSKNEMK
tara:strand:- start:4614 stop:5861 length:1248 start_codon:yes stop_codon:yes gene_type:complete